MKSLRIKYLVQIFIKYASLFLIGLLMYRLVINFLSWDLELYYQIRKFIPFFEHWYHYVEVLMWLVIFFTAKAISCFIYFFLSIWVNPQNMYPFVGFLILIGLGIFFIFLFQYKIEK